MRAIVDQAGGHTDVGAGQRGATEHQREHGLKQDHRHAHSPIEHGLVRLLRIHVAAKHRAGFFARVEFERGCGVFLRGLRHMARKLVVGVALERADVVRAGIKADPRALVARAAEFIGIARLARIGRRVVAVRLLEFR